MRFLPADRARQQVVFSLLTWLPGPVQDRQTGPRMPVVRQDAVVLGPSRIGLSRVRLARGVHLQTLLYDRK